MITIYALHSVENTRHFTDVIEFMQKHGAPRIRAHWRKGAWWALEGSHRIAAAARLGISPIIDSRSLDQRITHDTIDLPIPSTVRRILSYYDQANWWVRFDFGRHIQRGELDRVARTF